MTKSYYNHQVFPGFSCPSFHPFLPHWATQAAATPSLPASHSTVGRGAAVARAAGPWGPRHAKAKACQGHGKMASETVI
jgi:hypothetical protein